MARKAAGLSERHVDLQIGLFEPRVGADQGTGIDPGVREVTGAADRVLHRRFELERRAHRHVVDRHQAHLFAELDAHNWSAARGPLRGCWFFLQLNPACHILYLID